METKITLDKETFKALAIDTRVKILKELDEEYQLTLTDLAKKLGMAPSTIKEHLDILLEVGLIQQIDKGMKWKYYRLTDKGKEILNPHEKRVWIILGISALLLLGVFYRLVYKLNILGRIAAPSLETKYAAPVAERVLREEVTTTIIQEISRGAVIPYAELLLVLLLAIIIGICAGYLLRKRNSLI